jgi:hypothetical protein
MWEISTGTIGRRQLFPGTHTNGCDPVQPIVVALIRSGEGSRQDPPRSVVTNAVHPLARCSGVVSETNPVFIGELSSKLTPDQILCQMTWQTDTVSNPAFQWFLTGAEPTRTWPTRCSQASLLEAVYQCEHPATLVTLSADLRSPSLAEGTAKPSNWEGSKSLFAVWRGDWFVRQTKPNVGRRIIPNSMAPRGFESMPGRLSARTISVHQPVCSPSPHLSLGRFHPI